MNEQEIDNKIKELYELIKEKHQEIESMIKTIIQLKKDKRDLLLKEEEL